MTVKNAIKLRKDKGKMLQRPYCYVFRWWGPTSSYCVWGRGPGNQRRKGRKISFLQSPLRSRLNQDLLGQSATKMETRNLFSFTFLSIFCFWMWKILPVFFLPLFIFGFWILNSRVCCFAGFVGLEWAQLGGKVRGFSTWKAAMCSLGFNSPWEIKSGFTFVLLCII